MCLCGKYKRKTINIKPHDIASIYQSNPSFDTKSGLIYKRQSVILRLFPTTYFMKHKATTWHIKSLNF